MSRTLLMAHETNTLEPAWAGEAEPIIVNTDKPGAVVLELWDGVLLELDPDELKVALTKEAAA